MFGEKSEAGMAERRGAQVKAQALAGPTQMAKHIDVDRSYLDRLVGSGVLERLPGGFDIDATRVRYIEHLRAEKKRRRPARPQTPRSLPPRRVWSTSGSPSRAGSSCTRTRRSTWSRG